MTRDGIQNSEHWMKHRRWDLTTQRERKKMAREMMMTMTWQKRETTPHQLGVEKDNLEQHVQNVQHNDDENVRWWLGKRDTLGILLFWEKQIAKTEGKRLRRQKGSGRCMKKGYESNIAWTNSALRVLFLAIKRWLRKAEL